jgi:hypothetical protein
MLHHTDAAHGVIPQAVADWAVLPFSESIQVH